MDAYLEVWGAQGCRPLPLAGERVVIGRDNACQVAFPHDGEVSRRHAVVEQLPVGWSIRDLGSRNGTFVGGQRLLHSCPLEDRDEIRVGQQRLVFRTPTAGPPLAETEAAAPPPELTRRERDVLHALLAPVATADPFTEPASIREMAAALWVSEAAVKQHLANLYEKFGISDGERRRVRLANEVLRRGAVRLSDLRQSGTAG